MDKTELRKFTKEKRKTLDIEHISSEIAHNIEKMIGFRKSHNVLLFYPKKYEI